MVGLDDSQITRKVTELSGGQKQRVAIARALVTDAKYILAEDVYKRQGTETEQQVQKNGFIMTEHENMAKEAAGFLERYHGISLSQPEICLLYTSLKVLAVREIVLPFMYRIKMVYRLQSSSPIR